MPKTETPKTFCYSCGAEFYLTWVLTIITDDGPVFCPFCGERLYK